MRKIALLGSSGVIGQKTLNVVRSNPDKFRIVSLVCGGNTESLKRDYFEFRPDFLGAALSEKPFTIDGKEVAAGADALGADAIKGADIVVVAVSGCAALPAVIAAARAGKIIALANKESIVCAGELILKEAEGAGARIIPVDSEHSTVFQLIEGRNKRDIRRVILTASGGALRNYTAKMLETATFAEALRHPTWRMGDKITVDSASMANKGLEIIEADRLFGVKDISYIIHPQSIIHSMVELADNTVLAGLSLPDMELPIQYALGYPDRFRSNVPSIDFAALGALEFLPPDEERFPMPKLAREALAAGGLMTAVYNAANEAANLLFREGKIGFTGIPRLTERAMERTGNKSLYTLDDVYRINDLTREYIMRDYSSIL